MNLPCYFSIKNLSNRTMIYVIINYEEPKYDEIALTGQGMMCAY